MSVFVACLLVCISLFSCLFSFTSIHVPFFLQVYFILEYLNGTKVQQQQQQQKTEIAMLVTVKKITIIVTLKF